MKNLPFPQNIKKLSGSTECNYTNKNQVTALELLSWPTQKQQLRGFFKWWLVLKMWHSDSVDTYSVQKGARQENGLVSLCVFQNLWAIQMLKIVVLGELGLARILAELYFPALLNEKKIINLWHGKFTPLSFYNVEKCWEKKKLKFCT